MTRKDTEGAAMKTKPYYLVGNIAEHSCRVVCCSGDLTDQEIAGGRDTIIGRYATQGEAELARTKWSKCPAAEQGGYCYTHNPTRS